MQSSLRVKPSYDENDEDEMRNKSIVQVFFFFRLPQFKDGSTY